MAEGKGRLRRREEDCEGNSEDSVRATRGVAERAQFGTVDSSGDTAGILEINTRGILRKSEGVGGIKRAGARASGSGGKGMRQDLILY
jgi:hypothetical protein